MTMNDDFTVVMHVISKDKTSASHLRADLLLGEGRDQGLEWLARDRARDQALELIRGRCAKLASGARATIDRASCIRSPKSWLRRGSTLMS